MINAKSSRAWDLILAFVCTLFLISCAVIFTLNFTPLYYFCINYFDIPSLAGMSVEEIKSNYQALIEYNSLFFNGSLIFPTLPMSEAGAIHFEEVKDVFKVFQYTLMVTLPLSVIGGIIKLKKGRFRFLFWTSLLTLGIPLVLGVAVTFFWEKSFLLFHQVVFNNDLWIFDWNTDPVINMLPDEFFLSCALLILILLLLCSVICQIAYRMLSKSRKKAEFS